MCSGVQILLSRRVYTGRQNGRAMGTRMFLTHAGRITTYTILGGMVGLVRETLGRGFTDQMRVVQGVLALAAACLAIYMALALTGKAPSPELLLSGLTRTWGRTMRQFTATPAPFPFFASSSLFSFSIGLLWGLLPCGMILSALLVAATSSAPGEAALYMLAFGLGTLPALFGVNWFFKGASQARWPRYLAAGLLALFGVQIALRGLAAWGVINHYHIHSIGLVFW
jgi:uncharacterized protein